MRTKLLTTLLGFTCAALLIIGCQPILHDAANRPGIRAVSAHGTGPDAVPSTRAAADDDGDGSEPRGRPTGTETTPTTSSANSSPTSTSPTTSPDTSSTTVETAPAPVRPNSSGGDIERQWYGTGPRVAILGDSLTVQARAHLREMAAGRYSLKVGALYGEGISGGALSVNLPDPIMPAVVEQYAEDPPDVVVFALGTNDVWQTHTGLASFERQWHTATRRFPAACVVGVTVTETEEAWLYDAVEARQINRVIRRTVDAVVDWSSEGASSRYTDTDNIHLTSAGREHFAELVMAGIDRCNERRQPTPGSRG